MKLTAICPWFGSKRTLAPRIVEALGRHSSYWEPFCGSMAVLLAKPKCSMETVNDLNGDLVNLSRIIQHDTLGPQLYRRLRRVLASQHALEDAREHLHHTPLEEGLDIDRAAAYFVNSWLAMNGTAGTRSGLDGRRGIARRFSSSGGAPAIRFVAAVDSIPAWRSRLRTVFILKDDGIDLCERIHDQDGTVIYADPPYLKKSEPYIHDFDDSDHQRLAAALLKFTKARVVVSYYDDPRLAEMYPDWIKIDCSMNKTTANTNKAAGYVVAPEVLLINDRQPTLFS